MTDRTSKDKSYRESLIRRLWEAQTDDLPDAAKRTMAEAAQELEGSRVETQAPLSEDFAHLDTVQLRRILDRHIRWRSEALRLLEQVNKGYEGEWPELAKFIEQSTTRLIPASAEKAGAFCSRCGGTDPACYICGSNAQKTSVAQCDPKCFDWPRCECGRRMP
jgi:hypothetical protein